MALAACGGEDLELEDELSDARRREPGPAINEYRPGSGGFVEIVNPTDLWLDFDDWQVDDRDGREQPVRFDALIGPHEVHLVRYDGLDTGRADQVRLLDPSGRVVDAIDTAWDEDRRPSLEGLCFHRTIYPWVRSLSEPASEAPCTPGTPNLGLARGEIVINEFQPGRGGFIEIMNASRSTIAQWQVWPIRADDGPGSSAEAWGFEGELSPGEVTVIPYDGFNSASRELIQICTPEHMVLDEHDNFFAGRSVSGLCFGRIGGQWAQDSIPCSPGDANRAPSTRSSVRINEYQPGRSGFVELYNAGRSPVDLTGWSVDDQSGGSAPRDITSTVLAPFTHLRVSYGGINTSSSDQVRLIDPSGAEIDRIPTSSSPGTSCYARVPDGGSWAPSSVPCTPGANNSR
jgi:hypothetical protein